MESPLKRKPMTGMITAASILIVLTASVALISIKRASELADLHSVMKARIAALPPATWGKLKQQFKRGVSIYYNLAGQSSLFAIDPHDTLYDKFQMERWAVEGSAAPSGPIRILVPEFGWNPQYVDTQRGGWLLSGEVGSSVMISNPRIDPEAGGRMVLELIDRSEQGIVLALGEPSP